MSGPVTGFDPGFASELVSTVPVQDTPTKLGEVAAGSLIINDSLTSRVWLADQPTYRGSNFGMPLDPKTSVLWTKTSPVFAVVDTAAVDPASIVITRQANSWTPSPSAIATLVAQQAFATLAANIATQVAQQAFSTLAQTLLNTGSRIIDQPFVAARANLTSGVEQAAFFNVSAALFQSYTLMLQFSNGAASATNYATVELRFEDDAGNVVWRDLIEVNRGNVETYVTDRMHGQTMTLMPTFPGGTLFADWVFSNRPVARLNFQEQANNDRILAVSDTINVGAGATSGFHFLPGFHGPCDIYIRTDQTVNYVAEFYFGSLAAIAFRLSGAAGADSFRETLLPLRPLRYRITNSGGVAANFFTSVWTRDN